MKGISSPPVALTNKPSGKLYLRNSQDDLATGTLTKVEMADVMTGFTDGIEDTVNNRITPGVAGLYTVHALVDFIHIDQGAMQHLFLKMNGSDYHVQKEQASAVGGTAEHQSMEVSIELWFDDDDYIELWVKTESSGDNVDVGGHTEGQATYLEVQRVR